MHSDLISYYDDRAAEYEKIYSKPERQGDLEQVTRFLQEACHQKSVLEVACGTGYWTLRIAQSAASVHAIDINRRMIDLARQKPGLAGKASFDLGDIYSYTSSRRYACLFGGFIWSHVPHQELDGFLEKMSRLVAPGGRMIFVDNTYVEGSNLPLVETDEQGNTYQSRTLENGRTYTVLKNFPAADFILHKLSAVADDIRFIQLTYYWILSYKPLPAPSLHGLG